MSFIHVTDENILSILENTRTNNIFKIVQVKIHYIFHFFINCIKYFLFFSVAISGVITLGYCMKPVMFSKPNSSFIMIFLRYDCKAVKFVNVFYFNYLI